MLGNPTSLIWTMLGLLVLFVAGFFLYKPLKVALKVLLRGGGGILIIFIFNMIFTNFPMGINGINLLICGVLGAPGLALLYGFTYLL